MDTRTKKERNIPKSFYHVSPYKIPVGGSIRPQWSQWSMQCAVWCLSQPGHARMLAEQVYRLIKLESSFGYFGTIKARQYQEYISVDSVKGLWIYRVKPKGPIQRSGKGHPIWETPFPMKVVEIYDKYKSPELNECINTPNMDHFECTAWYYLARTSWWGDGETGDAFQVDKHTESTRESVLDKSIKYRAKSLAEDFLRMRDLTGGSFERFIGEIKGSWVERHFLSKTIGGTYDDIVGILRNSERYGRLKAKLLERNLEAWLIRNMAERANEGQNRRKKEHKKLTPDPRYNRAKEKIKRRKQDLN